MSTSWGTSSLWEGLVHPKASSYSQGFLKPEGIFEKKLKEIVAMLAFIDSIQDHFVTRAKMVLS